MRERQIRLGDAQIDRHEYKLLNPNEVRTIDEDEALVISKNRNPVKLKVTPFYKNRKFRKASEFPAVFHHYGNRTINVRLVEL